MKILMKVLLILSCALCPLTTWAQSPVAVTATVTGANGVVYANGTYNIQLADASGNALQQATIGPTTITQTQISGTLSASGALTANLYANANFYPVGTKWEFNVCSVAPSLTLPITVTAQVCFNVGVTISGAGSISSALSAAAPAVYLFNPITGQSSASSSSPVSNLSGGVLGSLPYQSAASTTAFLAPNTTTTLDVLAQTGTGTVGAAPVWLATSGTGNVARVISPTFTTPNLGAATSSAMTITGLTVGNCVQVTTGGLLTTTTSACGTSSGTITDTGSPVSGNLAFFSGATSITSGNLTGDVTTSGTAATTLATVNSNVGSFGSSTAIPSFTVNAKGLITAASTNAVIAPAGTLTGTTLASNVVTSSLTSVGTITTGVWNGTAIANANLASSATTVNGQTCTLGSTCTVTAVAAAGTLTGTTLASNVVSSSLTSVGTLANLTVTNAPIFTALTGYLYGNGSSAVTASTTIPYSALSGSPATFGTATNCSSSASPAVCASAAAGSVALPTNAVSSSIVVNTTAVTANSQIFAFVDDSLSTKLGVTCNSTIATLVGGLAVTARTAGTSFTISNNVAIVANPLCVSYLVVN